MEEKKEIRCGGCGKKTATDKISNIQIQTCCCSQNIPLCPDCWDKYKKPELRKVK